MTKSNQLVNGKEDSARAGRPSRCTKAQLLLAIVESYTAAFEAEVWRTDPDLSISLNQELTNWIKDTANAANAIMRHELFADEALKVVMSASTWEGYAWNRGEWCQVRLH